MTPTDLYAAILVAAIAGLSGIGMVRSKATGALAFIVIVLAAIVATAFWRLP